MCKALVMGTMRSVYANKVLECKITQLDADLAEFYASLLKSEQRHFECYLGFAKRLSETPINERLGRLLEVEAALIVSKDPEFRFHSGLPISSDSDSADREPAQL